MITKENPKPKEKVDGRKIFGSLLIKTSHQKSQEIINKIAPINIPSMVTIDAVYPSATLYIVPETQPPAVTIPIPKSVPATMVLIPTGRTRAADGNSPGRGFGKIQLNIPTKPIEETAIAIYTPFIFCPEPNKNKSLNEAAKQNLDF